MKSINSLRSTSLFSKDLNVIYMVSKGCVKYASILLQIFWFRILLGNCIVSHVSLHLFFQIIQYMHFLKIILLKGKLMGITFDVGRVTVYAHYTKNV